MIKIKQEIDIDITKEVEIEIDDHFILEYGKEITKQWLKNYFEPHEEREEIQESLNENEDFYKFFILFEQTEYYLDAQKDDIIGTNMYKAEKKDSEFIRDVYKEKLEEGRKEYIKIKEKTNKRMKKLEDLEKSQDWR